MPRALLITVRFLHGRYHGVGDWPPAPARLFQALVAGVARGTEMSEESRAALTWLEGLDPPVIAAPDPRDGQGVVSFVPNNDLDAVGGDPARIAEIRTRKAIRSRLFDAQTPFHYLWRIEDERWDWARAGAVVLLAYGLYQLGRGIDPAFAEAEILDTETAQARLSAGGGVIHRPAPGGGERTLACPTRGSLKSLEDRFRAGRKRFASTSDGGKAVTSFTRPPRGVFRTIAYGAPPARLVFGLLQSWDDKYGAWPLTEAAALVERVRDGAVKQLTAAVERDAQALGPGVGKADIERYLKGSKDSTEADKARRVRFIPLPSIGHVHTDPDIRRLLVEVPQPCPISSAHMEWALNGFPVTPDHDKGAGKVLDHVRLIVTGEDRMLRHYGVGRRACTWRTVTPAVLPNAERRRIDPARHRSEAKGGGERRAEEERAAKAVAQAFRHAGVAAAPLAVRVQREPFHARGARAEDFATGTRFPKRAFWHVEARFDAPIAGPRIIGDGRYLGLGLMAPAPEDETGVLAFAVTAGLAPRADPLLIAARFRRAILSRVGNDGAAGNAGAIPTFISGHNPDGSPARTGRRAHIAVAADPISARLFIFAPHRLERRPPTAAENGHWRRLQDAMTGFRDLNVGDAGRLRIAPTFVEADDPILGPSRRWRSITPYRPTRYVKHVSEQERIEIDVRRECARRALPTPRVSVLEARAGPREGLTARVRLEFDNLVAGPLLLGSGAQKGGGFCMREDE